MSEACKRHNAENAKVGLKQNIVKFDASEG